VTHLLREFAPIPEKGWALIEEEARSRLSTYMAARRLVDVDGPHGWQHSSTDLRRTEDISGPCEGVTARRRLVLPLVELRAEFDVSRRELEDAERGAPAIDLEGLEKAALDLALAENRIIFHGFEAGTIQGIAESSSHPPQPLPPSPDGWSSAVAKAVNTLKLAGIGGPYGLAIGPEGYTRIAETVESGVVLASHLARILDGPVVWAPGVRGAIVLSLRGGDFVVDAGQDTSIGYLHHDAESVRLYLEESFSFRVLEPDAAVVLQ